MSLKGAPYAEATVLAAAGPGWNLDSGGPLLRVILPLSAHYIPPSTIRSIKGKKPHNIK